MATLNEALALALADHQAGRLQSAANLYQQILSVDPHHADALHLLGVVSHQTGQMDQAESLIQNAISINRQVPNFYNSLGNLHCDQKKYEAAIEAYQKAIQLQPRSQDAYLNLGGAYYDLGKLNEAKEQFKHAIRLNKDFADAHNNLGNVYKDLQQYDEAVASYKRAARLQKDYAEPHFNLGNLYRDQAAPKTGKGAEQLINQAIEAYQKAISANPQFEAAYVNLGTVLNAQERYEEAIKILQQALSVGTSHNLEVFNNLGNAYKCVQRWGEALTCYQQAVQIKPDFAEGYSNLGTIFKEIGKIPEAITCYQQALRIRPDFLPVHSTLANLFILQDKMDEGIQQYRNTIALAPDMHEHYVYLGIALLRTNRPDEAAQCYRKAYELTGNDAFRIKEAMSLPAIYQNVEEVTYWRERLTQAFAQLHIDGVNVVDPVGNIGSTNFYMAYHGQNDKDLQEQFGKFFKDLPKIVLNPNRPPHAKPRIGFISRLLRSRHTIGRLYQGIINKLSREKFDVTFFGINETFSRMDPIEMQPGDETVWLPENQLAESIEMIQKYELDVLFYTDIGMDPHTYFLAHTRLASVQCVTWGHPVTTGIPTVDYYISWKEAEVPHAQEHYTEKLALLENLTTYYVRPDLGPSPKTRKDFGIPDDPDVHVYACSQSLFKLHPEFDDFIAQILRRDPKGQMFFLHHKYKHFGEALIQRWKRTMPDVLDRITILDRLNDNEFLAFQACVDVLLDPTHFGGGITTLEAFTFGTPVITLPSEFLRGRLAVGFYKTMGIMDCVADSKDNYIEIALRLGTDAVYRQEVKNQILERNSVFYENIGIVHELEAFFLEAIETAQTAVQEDSDNRQEVYSV